MKPQRHVIRSLRMTVALELLDDDRSDGPMPYRRPPGAAAPVDDYPHTEPRENSEDFDTIDWCLR